MKRTLTELDIAIRSAIERETAASPHRDRRSRERVHPTTWDVVALIKFALDNRKRQPGVIDAARLALKTVDTQALRHLLDAVRDGPCKPSILRLCDRVESMCNTIEAALRLRPVTH